MTAQLSTKAKVIVLSICLFRSMELLFTLSISVGHWSIFSFCLFVSPFSSSRDDGNLIHFLLLSVARKVELAGSMLAMWPFFPWSTSKRLLLWGHKAGVDDDGWGPINGITLFIPAALFILSRESKCLLRQLKINGQGQRKWTYAIKLLLSEGELI